jgi:Lamin Tail Domain/Protein of unknown function (DUF1524)
LALCSSALTLVATGLLVTGPAGTVAAARATPAVRTFSSQTLLGRLTVGSTFHTGYVRSKFTLWTQHSDGCNTRYEVLIRDAVKKPDVGPGCFLTRGKWISPYDGFTTTNPTKIQIDHVVPLAVAWGSGAWRWTAATREAFANDLGTRYDLLAVSGHANESKGDSGPDEWLPTRKSFDCRYMTDYTAVLWRWQLHIDPAQKSFLSSHLKACGWPSVKEPTRPAIHRRATGGGGGGRSGNTATGIRITSINFDSPGKDEGGNVSLNGEWVEVTNTSSKSAELGRWILHDTSDHRFNFPTFRLKAHDDVKIHTGAGSDTEKNLFWGSTGYIWNNDGDTATLDNAAGKKVDSCSYTESADPRATC